MQNVARLLGLLVALAALPLPTTVAQLPGFVPYHDGQPSSACIHDGDTIWFEGEKIRLLDIDAREQGPPNCTGPAQLAVHSRDALIEILNAGQFTLQRNGKDR